MDDNSLNHITSPFYKKIIINRGNWLLAILTERIQPITDAQKAFLNEFRKISSNNFDFNTLDPNIRALIIWKGYEKIKGISMNLVYGKNKKNRFSRKYKKFKASGSFTRKKYSASKKAATKQEIEELRNYSPPLKIKKNKLDPNKTRRWTEKGFHTRDGSKKMNKGRFDES